MTSKTVFYKVKPKGRYYQKKLMAVICNKLLLLAKKYL